MRWPWGMSGYQWAVVMAAWMGWGFDIIDAMLFNFVAENCITTLLKPEMLSPEALVAAIRHYNGLMTSILLLGWAVGGIFFGWLADKIGRTKTLFLTITLYSLGTALCALAPNVGFLIGCRVLSSLGIGGEWAAGAAMVAEVVPERRRAEAGALLYTSAPVGLVCAALINKGVAGYWLVDRPDISWRVVFLFGLIPALAAMLMRAVLKEPEAFQNQGPNQPRLRELFQADLWPLTRSGILMAVTALLSWWTLNAFLPSFAGGLAAQRAQELGLDPQASSRLIEGWKLKATGYFSLGGLVGTLLTVPFANHLGRKAMFALYFASSALAIAATYGLPLSSEAKLLMQGLIGLTVFGVFGSFTYYLPELFPTRLRATGSGFCYNIGRVLTAFGPVVVAKVAQGGPVMVQRTLFWVCLIPLFGVLVQPWVKETKATWVQETKAKS